MAESTEKATSANADGVFEPFHISRVPREVKLTGEDHRKSATMKYWEGIE